MRGVNVGGQVMQIQQNPGINTANGFLQSIPVQNIPGLGNVQVIPASALQQQTVQTLPAANGGPIVATHLDNADPTKWQILQTIQSNGTISSPASGSHQHQVNNTSNISGDTDSSKQHRRRVACTCPNCGDGDRYNLNTLPNHDRRLLSHFGKTYQRSEVAFLLKRVTYLNILRYEYLNDFRTNRLRLVEYFVWEMQFRKQGSYTFMINYLFNAQLKKKLPISEILSTHLFQFLNAILNILTQTI